MAPPVLPVDAIALAVNLPHYLEKHKLDFGATDYQIRNAPCRQVNPLPTSYMEDWLIEKAGSSALPKEDRVIAGISFKDQSRYLLNLFERLVTWELPVSAEGKTQIASAQKRFNSKCETIICATTEVFGQRAGVQLLYLLGRYGLNASHYKHSGIDAWTSADLDLAITVSSDYPDGLLARNFGNKAINLSDAPHSRDERRRAQHSRATQEITLFPDWITDKSAESKERTLFHELAHALGDSMDLSRSEEWRNLAASKLGEEVESKQAVSKYAEVSFTEDFAESVVSFRFNPHILYAASPAKYEFIKSKVFQGLGYTSTRACARK